MVTKPHAEAPLSLRARTVFEDLGYKVVSENGEMEARRGNKNVEVVPVSEPGDIPETDSRHDKLCFVAEDDALDEVEQTVDELEGLEAAVIGLDGGDYSVVRSP